MNILIVHHLEGVWANRNNTTDKIQLNELCNTIYNWAIDNLIDKVIVTRCEDFYHEGATSIFQEFDFEVQTYGSSFDTDDAVYPWLFELDGFDVRVAGNDTNAYYHDMTVALKACQINFSKVGII